jgi:hypothetical protein
VISKVLIESDRKEFSVLNGLEWIVLSAAVLGVFVVGDLGPLWQPNLQATHRLAIAATAFDIRSTAPRIVAITTTTAPAMHTARTSFRVAFPN